jgi:two-component system phosphate regulon response regulator PhoB
MNILIAEDDQNLVGLMADALREAHFMPDIALSAEEASYKLKVNKYNLAILDWCFAGEKINGLDLARQICESKDQIPVLMLTSKTNLIDRVTGLNCGADDYLAKPFYLPELIARVHALLRRGKSISQGSKIKVGDLMLDTEQYATSLRDKVIPLNNKEFQLLYKLVEKSGKTQSRANLMEEVWGDHDGKLSSNTIDVHVRRIREKLGSYGRSIHTVHGIGYRFDPC